MTVLKKIGPKIIVMRSWEEKQKFGLQMIVPKKWPKNDCHEKLGGVGRQAQYYPLSQSD